MARLGHLLRGREQAVSDLDPVDLRPRRHHGRDVDVAELDHVADDLALRLVEVARDLGALDDLAQAFDDLARRGWIGFEAHHAQERAARGLERVDDPAQRHLECMEGRQRAHQDPVAAPQRDRGRQGIAQDEQAGDGDEDRHEDVHERRALVLGRETQHERRECDAEPHFEHARARRQGIGARQQRLQPSALDRRPRCR